MKRKLLKFRFSSSISFIEEIVFIVKAYNRDELIDKLIIKNNTFALYCFLMYFPKLSHEQEEKIKHQIFNNENVKTIEEYKQKRKDWYNDLSYSTKLRIRTSLLIIAEEVEKSITF